MTSLPIFDPLPVPPFEVPERVQQIRERAAEARLREADLPSPDRTPDRLPNHTPTVVAVLVPARVQTAPAKEPGLDPVRGIPAAGPVLIQPEEPPPSRG